MSDMIDRLDELAGQVGADAGERLESAVVVARLAGEVRRGVRRRRTVTAALTAVVAVMAGAAAVGVPHLLRPAQLPAAGVREPVHTEQGLITYDDGSMQVLTHSGAVVDVPAGVPAFAIPSASAGCAVDVKTLTPGWTIRFTDAFQLVSFARQLLLDDSGYHLVAQGDRVQLGADARDTTFAFSVDVDPAIAPYVVMKVSSYVLAPDGSVALVGSQLESRPAVEYAGDKAAGTYTVTLTTRGLKTLDACPGAPSVASEPSVIHYMSVDVFLNDGHGHTAPIATHTSWFTLVREAS